jgi:hypothetical protein
MLMAFWTSPIETVPFPSQSPGVLVAAKTHAAPVLLLSPDPPAMAVLASAERDTDVA